MSFYTDNIFYHELLIHVPTDNGCECFSLIDSEQNQVKTLEFLQTIKDKQKLLDVLNIIGSPA